MLNERDLELIGGVVTKAIEPVREEVKELRKDVTELQVGMKELRKDAPLASDVSLLVMFGVAAFGIKLSSIATLSMPGFCATCTMLFSNMVTNRLPFS